MKIGLKIILGLFLIVGLFSCMDRAKGKQHGLIEKAETYEENCDSSCGGLKKACTKAGSDRKNIHVYYFHYSRRCATCKAVELVTSKALNEYYGNKVDFISFNLDEESSKEVANGFEIEGQTLLIVKGGQKIDITNEAFMTARKNPNKFREKVKNTIDAIL